MDYVPKCKKKRGIVSVDLQANGRRLSDAKILDRCLEVADAFLIALHSYCPEKHDLIARSVGIFSQTVDSMHSICEKGCGNRVFVQTVINRLNFRDLLRIYRFVNEDLGLRELNMTFPHPIGTCKSREVVPSYREAYKCINDALSYCLDNGMEPYVEAIPYCVLHKGKNREYLTGFSCVWHLHAIMIAIVAMSLSIRMIRESIELK